MKGYEILEKKSLSSSKEGGIEPFNLKMGFLDFLREINNGVSDIPPNSSFRVEGIDDILYMALPEKRDFIAREIHRLLQKAASTLERKRIEVQVICEGRLIKGESLWIEYRGKKLPIDLIFGSTLTNTVRGFPVYTIGFNLST